MEFGVFVATKIDDWQLIREAEALLRAEPERMERCARLRATFGTS